MKIFIPRDAYTIPRPHDDGLAHWTVEINEKDLRSILHYWECLADPTNASRSSDIAQAAAHGDLTLQYAVRDGTLSHFLLRPHVTLYAGSKPGNDDVAAQLLEAAEAFGYACAKAGFNMWYGGGNKGIMGRAMQSFQQGKVFPDQYAMQIFPAVFILGGPTLNGLKASNEGLCSEPDASIIATNLEVRKAIMRTTCVASFILPGSLGTLDEWHNDAVHAKTGVMDRYIYVVDTPLKGYSDGYYAPQLAQHERAIETGLEQEHVRNVVSWHSTPLSAFEDLMQKLDETGNNPHIVYAARKRIYDRGSSTDTNARYRSARQDDFGIG